MKSKPRLERFLWKPGEIVISPCVACKHKDEGGATCKAFSKGIPNAILSGRNDHTKNFPGDNGIQYEED